jgi:hypothetical protein
MVLSEQKVRLPLRIPASLKAKLAELAEREHRSVNKQIEETRELLRPRAEHGKRK